MNNYIDIVFDGPPGPTSGRFIEVENEKGQSLSVGKWLERSDGFWVLRISTKALQIVQILYDFKHLSLDQFNQKYPDINIDTFWSKTIHPMIEETIENDH